MNAVQMALIPSETLKKERRSIPLGDLPVPHTGARPERDLIDSIKTFGTQVPILVRERAGAYVLVDGRRRVAAQRIAMEEVTAEHGADSQQALCLMAIDADVISGLSASVASVLTIGLHATRRENAAVELDAIEELLGIGAGEAEICEATGLMPHQIRARLRLQRLNRPLREAFRAGQITTHAATDASRLPPAQQQKLAAKLTDTGRLTAHDVREARSAQAHAITSQLPDALFETVPEESESSEDTTAVVAIADYVLARTEGEWKRILSDDAVTILEDIVNLLPENLRP